MVARYLKIVFVALISLLCLFYGIQNVVNLDACYQAFAYVLGAVDHQIYTAQGIPAVQSPAVIWLTLVLVVGLEFAAGLCAAKGTWDLGAGFRRRYLRIRCLLQRFSKAYRGPAGRWRSYFQRPSVWSEGAFRAG